MPLGWPSLRIVCHFRHLRRQLESRNRLSVSREVHLLSQICIAKSTHFAAMLSRSVHQGSLVAVALRHQWHRDLTVESHNRECSALGMCRARSGLPLGRPSDSVARSSPARRETPSTRSIFALQCSLSPGVGGDHRGGLYEDLRGRRDVVPLREERPGKASQ